LIKQRKFTAAETLLNEIITDTVIWHGAHSPAAADDQLDLGSLYIAWGKHEAAEESALRALEIGREVVDTDPKWGYRALEQLREIYQAAGDEASAERMESAIEKWNVEHHGAD
jgi:hypothetical protein